MASNSQPPAESQLSINLGFAHNSISGPKTLDGIPLYPNFKDLYSSIAEATNSITEVNSSTNSIASSIAEATSSINKQDLQIYITDINNQLKEMVDLAYAPITPITPITPNSPISNDNSPVVFAESLGKLDIPSYLMPPLGGAYNSSCIYTNKLEEINNLYATEILQHNISDSMLKDHIWSYDPDFLVDPSINELIYEFILAACS